MKGQSLFSRKQNKNNISKSPLLKCLQSMLSVITLSMLCKHFNRGDNESVKEPQRENTYLLPCTPNKDSNQSVHQRSLITVLKKLCILGYAKCAQRRFRSACANAQADLNLRWAHMSEDTFSDVVAPIYCF